MFCPQQIGWLSSWIDLSISTRILHTVHSNSYVGIGTPNLCNPHDFALRALDYFHTIGKVVRYFVNELLRDFLAFPAFKLDCFHSWISSNSRSAED
jgi:hypothetical protein